MLCLRNKVSDPNLFWISDASNPLSDCSKNLKKKLATGKFSNANILRTTVYNASLAKANCVHKFFVLFHQLYEELDKTPFTLVETAEQLQELSQRLSALSEFAVDLEVDCVK